MRSNNGGFMQYFRPQHDLAESKLGRIPAYSFERVADSFLLGIQNGLTNKGFSELEAECFITSKILRCELDGSWDDALEELGRKLAEKVAQSYLEDCRKWAHEDILENI
jgi:hypothetical protein